MSGMCTIQIRPSAPNTRVTRPEHMSKERYQKLEGRLIYLSNTCLDVTFAISMVRQFMHETGSINFETVIES